MKHRLFLVIVASTFSILAILIYIVFWQTYEVSSFPDFDTAVIVDNKTPVVRLTGTHIGHLGHVGSITIYPCKNRVLHVNAFRSFMGSDVNNDLDLAIIVPARCRAITFGSAQAVVWAR